MTSLKYRFSANKSETSDQTAEISSRTKNRARYVVNASVNLSFSRAKQRSVTSTAMYSKCLNKKHPRDLSDPNRRKIKYFEIKQNERPATKLESLKSENKNLVQLLEKSKIQLEKIIDNSKKERIKFIEELIKILTSLKNHKNAVTQAVSFLKKLKLDPENPKSVRSSENELYKLSQTSKLQIERDIDNEF